MKLIFVSLLVLTIYLSISLVESNVACGHYYCPSGSTRCEYSNCTNSPQNTEMISTTTCYDQSGKVTSKTSSSKPNPNPNSSSCSTGSASAMGGSSSSVN